MKNSNPQPFEVYAIRYAIQKTRTAGRNFMHTDSPKAIMPIDFFIWLLKRKNEIYVVDTGFNKKTAKERKITLLCNPVEELAKLKVDSKKVKNVIITHMHYDHIGNLDLFPKAQFHLQDIEMSFATGRHMSNKLFRRPYDVGHIKGMIQCVYEERVRFHNGDEILSQGLSLHHVGGHTKGLQFVRVFTARGWVVLASDACHLYANIEQKNPFPVVYNVEEMLKGHRKLRQYADSKHHIVPGHDPLVMERYESPAKELKGIVVQLDKEPKK
ncbi:N-acyl homoserine lactonase family protein [Candidatus Falkowbacteria bacterium]|nr:N-acyl homoserine lactonase family protein [Candidatus Falkowbacteria bacterium]